ncbi:MAG: DUF4440 domain-containing protein [Chthoniobacterales bacterium]
MKRYVTCAIAALFTTSLVALASPETDAAMTREKAAWQAYKDRKTEEFRKILAPTYQSVYSDGMCDAAKEVADMTKMTIKSFSLSDLKAVSTDADTMIVTYKVALDATVDGKAAPSAMNAASVWQKQGSDWQVIFHTNVPADSASGAAK